MIKELFTDLLFFGAPDFNRDALGTIFTFLFLDTDLFWISADGEILLEWIAYQLYKIMVLFKGAFL